MAGDTGITHVGNLVDHPELRFTPSGAAVEMTASGPGSTNRA
jgi:single-stranded DNA-binding protein